MEVCANWVPESSTALQNIVKECEELPSGGLDSLLDEDCCLSLSKPLGDSVTNDCTLSLSTKSLDLLVEPGRALSLVPPDIYHAGPIIKRKTLNGILIVSEARLIEVFKGQYEEYYKTVQGELVAEFEESKLYQCVIAFDKGEKNVTLKFKYLCNPSSLWIYAIHASTKINLNTDGFGESTRFSGKHLSSVLEEHNVVVSDEASKFRSILESFNNDRSSRVRASDKDPMQMMMMMGAMMGMHTGSRKTFQNDFDQSKLLQNPSLLRSKVLDNGNDSQSHHMPSKHFLESLLSTKPPDDTNACSGRRCSISSQTESCSGESSLSDTSLDGDETIPKSPIKMTISDNKVHDVGKMKLEDNVENFIGKIQSFLTEEGNEAKKDKINFLIGLAPKNVSCLSKAQSHESKDKNLDESKIKLNKTEEPKSLKAKLHRLNNIESNQLSITESIETIIDDKINAMEERLLRKFDDRFNEKKKEDHERFDKLEKMLMQLMENQMHNKS
ncbi:unnamed protein product [Meganyctiphanes norvegica]|uniref:Uncharacterized protein n=1 Tax=Meganyctiphanes norvegica TaxID=48144 RepID=A0AAV2QDR6_MEGNR